MLEATQRVGKYVLRERLGRGAVTEVWKGFDSHLQRDIVMKLLPRSSRTQPDLIERFLQQARAMATLQHPNIVQVYDIAESAEDSDVAAYMVTSYVQGMTLADYIMQTSRVGKIPAATQIVQLFTAISSAINHAHQQGMVHGNIKPTNILLDQHIGPWSPGLPTLTDFGFARLQSAGSDNARDTSIVIGSPLYSAPELARGGAPTKQSDLYALGMILYELCTGKLPFASLEQRPLTLLFQKMTSEPPAPSRLNPMISPALEAVILRSIAHDPQKRFPTAQTMTRALARALSVPLSQMLAAEYYGLCSVPELEQAPVKPGEKDEKASERPPTPPVTAQRERDPERRLPEKDKEPSVANKPSRKPRRQLAIVARRLQTHWLIPLCVLSFLVIVGLLFLSPGVGQLLSRGHVTSSAILGQALFISSGQGDILQGQGINDEVRIDLTHLAEPAPGKTYFAWLQGDLNRSDSPIILLGQFGVSQDGAAHLTYVDPQHTDLLAKMSRVLVTEEDSGARPIVPSSDKTSWKYAGTISQTPNPTDQRHYSLLDHLRHLLASDPDLEALGLHDGLAFWFYRNTGRLQQYAQSARNSFDAHDTTRLYRQLVSLLDYLDGIKDVGRDIPEGTPVFVDTTSAQVGLLQLHADQNPPGYLYHIGLHLSGLLASPGATAEQRKIAASVVQELDTVSALLEQIHIIARQLVALSSDQLLQPQVKAQLATLTQLATAAYAGKGPGNEGVSRVYVQLASLALIPITAYQTT